MDNQYIIQAQNIVKKFPTGEGYFVALDEVSLAVRKGEFLIITGRSGSGKSTLLYQLSLLDNPNSGKIILDECDTSLLTEKEKTRLRLEELGYVFQDYALLPELTAMDNVILPLLMMGLSGRKARKMAMDTLDKVGLKDKMNNMPSQLSGGQQQRISIARAIVNSPKIVFADEPTANLDSETAKIILTLFKRLHSAGQTIIMATHEADYVKEGQRVLTISDGKIQ